MVALNKRILVVDDEPVVCESCQRVLSSAGYDVTTVLSGREALDACHGEPFDVVLVDIKMPDMSGLDVTKAIKRRLPQARIVIITGYASQDTRRESHHLGAFDYLAKPLTPDQLMEVAEAALTSASDQRFTVDEIPDESLDDAVSEEVAAPPTEPVAAQVRMEGAEADVHRDEAVQQQETRPAAVTSDADQTLAAPPGNTIKLLAMLAAAPLIGLAFILLLPIFGVGAFCWVVGQAAFRSLAGARA